MKNSLGSYGSDAFPESDFTTLDSSEASACVVLQSHRKPSTDQRLSCTLTAIKYYK